MQIWEQKGTRLFFFSFFKPAAAYRGCQRGGGSTQVVGTGPCVPPHLPQPLRMILAAADPQELLSCRGKALPVPGLISTEGGN